MVFSSKGDCLQHVLRKIFYDTLLIIQNDYNPFKYDYCIVGPLKGSDLGETMGRALPQW